MAGIERGLLFLSHVRNGFNQLKKVFECLKERG
jgi:hypothetical protein